MKELGILALLAACHGFELPGQPVESAHPIANAGTGSFYPLGTTVTLDGSRSFDPDDKPLTYSWSVEQHPDGSTTAPVDPSAAMTTFMLDQLGTYGFRLVVTDDAANTDSSDLLVVSTGAITGVDAGPDATVSWLATVQLAGTVSTVPGKTATYSWSIVSQPVGSTAQIQSGDTLRPTFLADAVGTYVVALDANVGYEVREDTVSIKVKAVGVSLGTGVVAYTYSTYRDRIIYVHDVGHAEVVAVDPASGAVQAAVNVGAFTPKSIAVDQTGEYVAIAGPGKVATVDLQPFVATSLANVPGCTAKHVAIPSYPQTVDCFPADGTIEPISSVNLQTSVVTHIACPLQYPDIALSGGILYMVDGASPKFDTFQSDPLIAIAHVSLAGVAPPVIPVNTSFPYAITGNGIALDSFSGAKLFDLQMPVSAGASQKAPSQEFALVSGSVLKVFGATSMGQSLKLSAVLPPVNGMMPITKLVAYSADGLRLIVVAGTNAGDVAYTVPR